MTAKQTLLLGCGLPAVGKTTVLRSLHRSTPAVYLDKDTVNRALLAEVQEDYFSSYYHAHVRNQSYAVMFALARDNLGGGCPLVSLDGQFGDKWSQPLVQRPLQQLRQEMGCSVKLVYCHCSAGSQLARMRRRGRPGTPPSMRCSTL